ncbi:hypothetical protein ACHAXA_010620 [Cyclostephanos tholiformis]|uniref:Uncharacterized protein n=1 Tax=Cyclostephanos tholiformis TaxID=382380 RepID=A0ABD3R8P7_9STRA
MASWTKAWTDILNGGSKRWKVDDIDAKRRALSRIVEHQYRHGTIIIPPTNEVDDVVVDVAHLPKLRILCPLAGDDPFVHYAWSQGHDVTAIDIVPDALGVMRGMFGDDADDWSSSTKASATALVEEEEEEGERGGDGENNDDGNDGTTVVWKHKSGRATLLEGNVLTRRPELTNSFDAVYDKDSFGALSLTDRRAFCTRISDYIKDGGTLYVEVKYKDQGRGSGGPPYHVEKEDLMDPSNFGISFEYVRFLGEVYPLNVDGMKQTGHILKRASRR